MPSDPAYTEINRLQEMLITLSNIRIAHQRGKGFVAGRLVDVDVAEAELAALETQIRQAQEGLLDKVQIASLEEVYGEFI